MRKTDIEFWALSVIERVEKRQIVEDSRVELKGNWIDPAKAARRIAAHANSSHSEPILWLIGVDEEEGIKGIDYLDFASWFNKVKSHFDGITPDSISISVPYQNTAVLAILFETDRAPYVVKNPLGGQIQFEVPWRDGTSTRTANRSELLRILVPFQKLPTIEVHCGKLTAQHYRMNDNWYWDLELQLYGASMLQSTLAIPFHQCSATFELNKHLAQTSLTNIQLRPIYRGPLSLRIITADSPRPQPDSLTIDGTNTELIIQGPGKFRFIASAITMPLNCDITDTVASIKASLRPADFEHAITVSTELKWDGKDLSSPQHEVKGRWALGGL